MMAAFALLYFAPLADGGVEPKEPKCEVAPAICLCDGGRFDRRCEQAWFAPPLTEGPDGAVFGNALRTAQSTSQYWHVAIRVYAPREHSPGRRRLIEERTEDAREWLRREGVKEAIRVEPRVLAEPPEGREPFQVRVMVTTGVISISIGGRQPDGVLPAVAGEPNPLSPDAKRWIHSLKPQREDR